MELEMELEELSARLTSAERDELVAIVYLIYRRLEVSLFEPPDYFPIGGILSGSEPLPPEVMREMEIGLQDTEDMGRCALWWCIVLAQFMEDNPLFPKPPLPDRTGPGLWNSIKAEVVAVYERQKIQSAPWR